MMALVEYNKITITGNNTVWFPHPAPKGLHTLWLHFPTGVTGTLAVVVSNDTNDSRKTAAATSNGTQVSHASGGAYATKAVDISGGKFIGVTGVSISGGSGAIAWLDSSQ